MMLLVLIALLVRWGPAALEVNDVLEGRARWCVIHGDNADVLPVLPDKSVAHVITDPPYSEHVHGKVRRGGSAHAPDVDEPGKPRRAIISTAAVLGFDAITQQQRCACAVEFARIVRRWVLEFCDDESAAAWVDANRGADLDHVRVGHWWKLGATPQFTGDRPATGAESIVIAHPPGRKRWNGGGRHATWAHAVCTDGDRAHTTQKPVSLMLELVELFTDPDEIILDPFAGSGTTGVACLRLGRRFIGVEKDAKYAAVARERLAAESQGLSLRDARAGQTSLFSFPPEAIDKPELRGPENLGHCALCHGPELACREKCINDNGPESFGGSDYP